MFFFLLAYVLNAITLLVAIRCYMFVPLYIYIYIYKFSLFIIFHILKQV